MFFKYLEFISLKLWHETVGKSTRYGISALSTLLGMIVFFALLTTTGIIVRSALFSLSFFFLIYWVISIFVYLYKKGQYGVFTRIIQRFWKRALWLFWLLELFLFFIYLFLAVISPQEVAYMLDNTQLVLDYSLNLKAFFTSVLNALLILLLANAQLLLHKYNTIRTIISCAITAFLLRAVTEDFLQFYAINNFYSSYSWAHARLETSAPNIEAYSAGAVGVWEQEVVELKTRTILHYLYLLIFLKLWHTVFIFTVYVFLENIVARTGLASFNILAANLQNFYFLMFFNYILKITMVKSYLNYLGTYVFYWFYLNYNIYDITYFYELFSWSYFSFAATDIL